MSALGLSGIHLNWRHLFKSFLGAVSYFLACFVILCLVYPIQERMRFSRYSLSQALPEYELMSLVVTCIVVVLVPLLTWWCNRLVIWMSVIIRTVTAFVLLYFLASSIGTSPQLINDPPTSRISTFFAEWQFLGFAFFYAPLVSVLAGVYYWWTGRQKLIASAKPQRYATRGRGHERGRDG
jgi:hypothetical protein